MASPKPLWTETPLRYAHHISQLIGATAYLKLENLQPSYSFKYRGISHYIQTKKNELGTNVHCVIASGGNAGLAAACAASKLQCRCTVFIPEGVSLSTMRLLESEGAEVVVGGAFYAEALKAAGEMVAKDPTAVMVPAYNDPLLWEGHSSMVKEIHKEIPKKPSAIFCSVGGGGLLGGILEGCKSVGWEDVPIVAIETIGSDCFYHSMSLNAGRFNASEHKLSPGIDLVYDETHDVHLAHFRGFSSKASGSLGASQPAEAVVRMALDWPGGVKTLSVPDGISMEALARFANDQKMLVELSCSTTLVPAYNPALFRKLLGPPKEKDEEPTVVFIVCGGFKVSVSEAAGYQEMINMEPPTEETWTVKCDDGSLFTFPKTSWL